MESANPPDSGTDASAPKARAGSFLNGSFNAAKKKKSNPLNGRKDKEREVLCRAAPTRFITHALSRASRRIAATTHFVLTLM